MRCENHNQNYIDCIQTSNQTLDRLSDTSSLVHCSSFIVLQSNFDILCAECWNYCMDSCWRKKMSKIVNVSGCGERCTVLNNPIKDGKQSWIKFTEINDSLSLEFFFLLQKLNFILESRRELQFSDNIISILISLFIIHIHWVLRNESLRIANQSLKYDRYLKMNLMNDNDSLKKYGTSNSSSLEVNLWLNNGSNMDNNNPKGNVIF